MNIKKMKQDETPFILYYQQADEGYQENHISLANKCCRNTCVCVCVYLITSFYHVIIYRPRLANLIVNYKLQYFS